jgi:hypothetical protein
MPSTLLASSLVSVLSLLSSCKRHLSTELARPVGYDFA